MYASSVNKPSLDNLCRLQMTSLSHVALHICFHVFKGSVAPFLPNASNSATAAGARLLRFAHGLGRRSHVTMR